MTRLRYPENIDGSTSDFVKFTFYNYEAPYARGNIAGNDWVDQYNRSATGGTPASDPIILTMPNDIGSTFQGNWGGKNLTGLAAAAYGGVGGMISTAKAGAAGGIGAAWSAATSNLGAFGISAAGGLAEDVLKTITQTLNNAPGLGSNLSVNDSLGLVSSYILNPNTELLYEGTQLRDHGYTFKMIAQTQTEAEIIHEIASRFKKAVLPKGDQGSFLGAGVRNFIGIPETCQVEFYRAATNGAAAVVHPYLPRFKRSAITNVSVDYISDGQYMTYTNGEPIGITLKVTFKELKLLFAEEIGTYR